MMKKIWVVLAVVVVGGGASFLWLSHRSWSPLPQAASVQADQAGVVKVDASDSLPQNSAQPVERNTQQASSPRQRYEQSRDLLGLTQDLRSAADNGDADAQVVIADAFYECLMITGPASNRDLGGLNAIEAHPALKLHVDGLIATEKLRCDRFVKQDFPSQKKIYASYAKAAQNGSAVGLARHLNYADLTKIPDSELAADIQQIKASRDPAAIAALSGVMGLAAEGREAAMGAPSGTETAENAWLLAACGMGMDCGSNSAWVRTECLYAGACEGASVIQILTSTMSPVDYRTAQAMSRQIIADINNHH